MLAQIVRAPRRPGEALDLPVDLERLAEGEQRQCVVARPVRFGPQPQTHLGVGVIAAEDFAEYLHRLVVSAGAGEDLGPVPVGLDGLAWRRGGAGGVRRCSP